MSTTASGFDPDDPALSPRADRPREGGRDHGSGDRIAGAGGRGRGVAGHGAIHAPGPATDGPQPDGAGAAYRRVARDDPQLGTGKALPDRRGACPVAGAGQGARDRAPRPDLKTAGTMPIRDFFDHTPGAACPPLRPVTSVYLIHAWTVCDMEIGI